MSKSNTSREELIKKYRDLILEISGDGNKIAEVSATYEWEQQEDSPYIVPDMKISYGTLGYDYFLCKRTGRDGIRPKGDTGPVWYTSQEAADEVTINSLMD